LYASKIKETANGSRRCACGKERQAIQVIAKRRVAPNGEVDESERATKNGEDKAQGEARAHTQEKVGFFSPFIEVGAASTEVAGHFASMTLVTSLRGSALILLAPVNG
jgi:hypothetical protein